MKKKSSFKWSPATPCRHTDGIMSSKARENGETAFIPSYEADAENMNYIMSYEYQRMWLNERARHEVESYAKKSVETGGPEIKRRFVMRDMTKKLRGNVLPPVTLKKFMNAKSKTDHSRGKEKNEKSEKN